MAGREKRVRIDMSIPNLVGESLPELSSVASNMWDAIEVHFEKASPSELAHLKQARRLADQCASELDAALEVAKEMEVGDE